VLASFVIVPALLYLVLRGDLAELRGPGGWAATFVRVARSTVNADGETLSVEEDVQIIEKEAMSGLRNRAGQLRENQPIVMTMTLGRSYTVPDVQGYLRTLSQFPRFQLIAFLDSSGAFIGCSSRAELGGLMQNDALGRAFLDAVRQGDVQQVFSFPGTLRKVVPSSATNAEALSEMTANKLEAIAVVGEDRKLRGVVERGQLVSKLVVSLTEAADLQRS
jgi:CBS-domain-containing membrane protein